MPVPDTTLERLLDFANLISETPLTDLSDDSAYDALVMLLHSSQLAINEQVDEHYRVVIANCLIKMDRPVIKPLLDYLVYEPHKSYSTGSRRLTLVDEHNRNHSRSAIAELLGYHDDEAVVPGLLNALETIGNLRVIKSVVHALVMSQDRDAIAGLTELLLSHPKYMLRKRIAEALAHCPDRGAELPLVLAMNDHHPQVSRAAIQSLGYLQSKSTIPFLAELISTTRFSSYPRSLENKMVYQAIAAMQTFRMPETRQLIFDWCINAIGSEQSIEAIGIIATLHDNRAIPYLLDILNDYQSFMTSLVEATENALIEIGTPEALSALEEWSEERI